MRHWKIRSKIIAGLLGLAMVIIALVYNTYNQLIRDRFLAIEISHLADEIDVSHELNKTADRLLRSHMEFQKLVDVDHSMIESDRITPLNESNSHGLRSQLFDDIDVGFLRLAGILEDYRIAIEKHSGSIDGSSLLFDRRAHRLRLDKIETLIGSARGDWEKSYKIERSFMRLDFLHASLDQQLRELVELTHRHFDSIQSGMRDFREGVHAKQAEKNKAFWAVTLFSTVLLGFLICQFWIGIVAPFRTLVRGSELIANGHHHHVIELGRDDELGAMANTVNDITRRFNRAMAQLKEAKETAEQEVRDRTREVIQNEQLASVGFLAAGVAHEINNPLGAIAWSAESLEDELKDLSDEQRSLIAPSLLRELETNVPLMQEEAYRCKGITKRLLNFSKLSDSKRESENISELVRYVVSMVAKVGEYRCKTVVAHSKNDVFAYCNGQEIQQVILNLVSNALESVDTDGRVDVFVRDEVDPLSGLKHATVVVKDDGCGMTQEVIEHLFEPFFTRRRDNTGTGLGLSISYRIVSIHHGSLTAHSTGEGQGSEMILRLPTEPPNHQTEVGGEPRRLDTQSSLADASVSPSRTWKYVEEVA